MILFGGVIRVYNVMADELSGILLYFLLENTFPKVPATNKKHLKNYQQNTTNPNSKKPQTSTANLGICTGILFFTLKFNNFYDGIHQLIDETRNHGEEYRRLHTGTGRISPMTMYHPMSLYESKDGRYEPRVPKDIQS